MEWKPISELAVARERLHSACGWAILKALLESDHDLAFVAMRVGRALEYVEERLSDPMKLSLHDVSDFLLALGNEADLTVHKRGEFRSGATPPWPLTLRVVPPLGGPPSRLRYMTSAAALSLAA